MNEQEKGNCQNIDSSYSKYYVPSPCWNIEVTKPFFHVLYGVESSEISQMLNELIPHSKEFLKESQNVSIFLYNNFKLL